MDKKEKRNMLYELERLIQTNGDPKRINDLRLRLGIVEAKVKEEKKPVVENKTKVEEKPKVNIQSAKELTVEIYHDLKAKGKSDALISSEFGMHNANFYQWKKKNNLITPRKNQEEPNKPKTEVIDPAPAHVEEIQLVTSQETIERPESAHYRSGSIDVWKFADENFDQNEVIGFHRINALKYIARYGKKNGKNVNDLKKAIVSLEKLIELEEAK